MTLFWYIFPSIFRGHFVLSRCTKKGKNCNIMKHVFNIFFIRLNVIWWFLLLIFSSCKVRMSNIFEIYHSFVYQYEEDKANSSVQIKPQVFESLKKICTILIKVQLKQKLCEKFSKLRLSKFLWILGKVWLCFWHLNLLNSHEVFELFYLHTI